MGEENIEDVTFENNDDNVEPEQGNEKDMTKQKPKPEKKSRKLKAEKKIDELQDQYNELNDKYLRIYSEFDNYRKRTNKERL
ncbi:MAG TPA: nucleotide exchange factor GrpE, partial [Bacteroidales bacterium]|nr:nucleotide exchange factor GrpE [Bacteroidales bacterium]